MKIIAFGAYGFGVIEHWQLLLPMCVAVVAGTFLGRGIGKRFSDEFFEWVFRGIMGVLALKLAWDGAMGLWGPTQ